jgi:hypothetical protein
MARVSVYPPTQPALEEGVRPRELRTLWTGGGSSR